jgi:hypothetical protein
MLVNLRVRLTCVSFIDDHDLPDVVGEAAFEAVHRFVVNLA